MGELDFCTKSDFLKTLATTLEVSITTDAGLPLYLVRLLHNKIITGFTIAARCYWLYFDFSKLSLLISPFLHPFIIAALIGKRWRNPLLSILALMPFYFIFDLGTLNLGQRIFYYKIFMMIYAVIGFIKISLYFFASNRKPKI